MNWSCSLVFSPFSLPVNHHQPRLISSRSYWLSWLEGERGSWWYTLIRPLIPCSQSLYVSVQRGWKGVPCPQWQIGLNTILAAEPVVCDLWWGKGQGALTLAPHQVTGSSKWRGREAETLFVQDNTSIHQPNFIICMEMNSFSNWILYL